MSKQQPPLIVTLDGPAGSGKSSVARALARRLGLAFLDTGAMYRGLAAVCLEAGIDPGTAPEAAIDMARRITWSFNWATDPPRLAVGDRDVTDRIRDEDVSSAASEVAAIGAVRQVLVEAQRQVAREHPRLVTEGRDQGSVVFPDAQVKFYLDAAVAERARRRALQLRAAGHETDEAELADSIRRRDHRDATRPDGPLVCPGDAIRLDTTRLGEVQVVDQLERYVRERAGGALPGRGTE